MRGQYDRRHGPKNTAITRIPPTLCHGVARIFLTAPLSYDAVALHRSQCEKLLRYVKLATSSDAPWFQDRVNDRRVAYLLQQTQLVRDPKADSVLILDDTLCEHVGSLFDYVDRHDNHGDDTYPLAHNPVTSHYVSGPVRFPVDLRLYRRYEELTCWEAFVHKHFPDRPIPTTKKERARFHKEVDPILLDDPAFQKLHQQFRTKIDLGIELLEAAIRHN